MPGKSHEKTLRFNPWTDIPTIPNAMSIAGAVLAWRGAKRIDTAAGVAQVAAGRFIDVLDGIASPAKQGRQAISARCWMLG